jgi:hypothetical protein
MESVEWQSQRDLSCQSLAGFHRIEIRHLRDIDPHFGRDGDQELSDYDGVIRGRYNVSQLGIERSVSLDVRVIENIEDVDLAGAEITHNIRDH